jgi:hypothetical protein
LYRRIDESTKRRIRYLVALPAHSDLADPNIIKRMEVSQGLICDDISSLSLVYLKLDIADILSDEGKGMKHMVTALGKALNKLKTTTILSDYTKLCLSIRSKSNMLA